MGTINVHNVHAAAGGGRQEGLLVTNATTAVISHVEASSVTARSNNSTVLSGITAGSVTLSSGSSGTIDWDSSIGRNTVIGGHLWISSGNFTVTDVNFYNIRSASADGTGTFLRCHFINDPPGPEVGRQTDIQWGATGRNVFNIASNANVTFEDSSFVNPSASLPGQTFIFNSWGTNPPSASGGGTVSGGRNLTLRNTVFDFRGGGNVGLLALYAGQQGSHDHTNIAPDHLLMDGVRIYTSDRSNQPLIWLYGNAPGSTAGTFLFRPNNVLNGTTLNLNSPQAITGQSDFIQVHGAAAMPVVQ